MSTDPDNSTGESSPAAPPLPTAERPPKRRLLLADDDRGVRESLGKLLRGLGYEVAVASHGGQALEMVFKEPFDLLLLDLNMPEMDGWETLSRVSHLRPTLPIVVITAQPNQRDWLARGGAHALMEKPLDLPLLLQTLQDLLSEQRPQRIPEVRAGRPRFRHLPPRRFTLDFAKQVRGWGIND
jgi:CheY-like chemotaxis protein